MPRGTISHLTGHGFGFIQSETGQELYFFRAELQRSTNKPLREGQLVEFEIVPGRGGRPQATKISLIQEDK